MQTKRKWVAIMFLGGIELFPNRLFWLILSPQWNKLKILFAVQKWSVMLTKLVGAIYKIISIFGHFSFLFCFSLFEARWFVSNKMKFSLLNLFCFPSVVRYAMYGVSLYHFRWANHLILSNGLFGTIWC